MTFFSIQQIALFSFPLQLIAKVFTPRWRLVSRKRVRNICRRLLLIILEKKQNQPLQVHTNLHCLSFIWRFALLTLNFSFRHMSTFCRIKIKQERGSTKYYLFENVLFDNLYSLIMFYRQNVLRSSEFSITLKEPVPQQNKHEMCEWYFPTTTREQSELILSQMPSDGSFLVRPSDKGPNTFVISFK